MSNRKTFLQKAAAVLAGSAASPVLSRRPASAADDRYSVLLPVAEKYEAVSSQSKGYTAGKYVLVIGGISQGPLHSVEGGHVTSDVVTQKLGADALQNKHIGTPKLEDVTFNCGLDAPSALSDWLKAALNKSAAATRDVGVIGLNFDNTEVEEQQFTQALITEIGFPACDASSKDAAFLQVKFAPGTARLIATNKGKAVPLGAGFSKTWLPSNFRLTIAGVDCTKISKIEGITWKGAASSSGGGAPVIGGSSIAAGGGNLTNLVVTVAESSANDFLNWQKTAMTKPGTSATKSGKLDFLTSNLQSVIASLGLNDLLIFKITEDKAEGAGTAVKRMKIEMAVGSLGIS